VFFESGEMPKKSDVLQLQRFAIESMKLLQDQKDLWERTSVSVDRERGLRVIATSRYVQIHKSQYVSMDCFDG
jgi:hypothetical protein